MVIPSSKMIDAQNSAPTFAMLSQKNTACLAWCIWIEIKLVGLGPPGACARFSERALRLKLRLRVFRSCGMFCGKKKQGRASHQSNNIGVS